MHLIPQAKIQQVMLSALEEYTGCKCVPSNTTKQMPTYPYISFSVINTEEKKGTYSAAIIEKDGAKVTVFYIPVLQKWSFTAQSDDDAQALEKAMLISDFFTEAKRLVLEDNDIIVADVGAITPRDNMLTIEYEYRKGLDVTLRLNNVIEETNRDIIEKVTFSNEENETNIEKE